MLYFMKFLNTNCNNTSLWQRTYQSTNGLPFDGTQTGSLTNPLNLVHTWTRWAAARTHARRHHHHHTLSAYLSLRIQYLHNTPSRRHTPSQCLFILLYSYYRCFFVFNRKYTLYAEPVLGFAGPWTTLYLFIFYGIMMKNRGPGHMSHLSSPIAGTGYIIIF